MDITLERILSLIPKKPDGKFAHGLRHSFASLAYHLQIPEQITMQIGGWADAGTMRKIYTHIAQADINYYSGAMSQFYKNANKNANGARKY